MDELQNKINTFLENMEDEIAIHKSSHMENEGVFVEEIDEKPVEKSFTERVSEVLKDFSK